MAEKNSKTIATKITQARITRLGWVVGERVIASLPILIFGCEAYLFRFRHRRLDPPVYTPLRIRFLPRTHEEALKYMANPTGTTFKPSIGAIIFAEIKVIWPRRLYPLCYPILRIYSEHSGMVGWTAIFLYRYACGRKNVMSDFIRINCIQAVTCIQVLFVTEQIYHRMVSIVFSATVAGHIIQNTLFLVHIYVVIYTILLNLFGKHPRLPIVSEASLEVMRK